MSKTKKETAVGAPSPELCNLWLARAFNAQDVEAAASMYHPDASIVQVDQVLALAASRTTENGVGGTPVGAPLR